MSFSEKEQELIDIGRSKGQVTEQDIKSIYSNAEYGSGVMQKLIQQKYFIANMGYYSFIDKDQSKLDEVIENRKYEFTKTEGEFKCPVLIKKGDNDPWVDLEYCESFCQGAGCKNLNTCQVYQLNKQDDN